MPSQRVIATFAALSLVLAALAPQAWGAHAGDSGELNKRWVRHGFSQGWALDAADLDDDGDDEIIYGGRKLAALDATSRQTGRPRWEVVWRHVEDNILDGGDNTWVTGLEMLDLTGDGVEDALVTSSDTDAYLIDGATGAEVWHNPQTGPGLSNGFALLDADDDEIPDLYPTGGREALSGATGRPLWESPVPKSARFVASAELDGEPGRDVIVSIHAQGAGTNPNSWVGAFTLPTVFAVSSTGELLYEYSPVSGVESIVGADVTGDGIDEVIIGTFNGPVYAVGELGLLWSTATSPGPVQELASADIDGDGFDEVLAGGGPLTGDDPGFAVVALDNSGAQLWREPTGGRVSTLEVVQLDDDEDVELIVAGGASGATGGTSYALGMETGLTQPLRVKWQVDTHREVKSATVVTEAGRRVAVLGSDDTWLRAVDAGDGEHVWSYAAGSYVTAVAAADLDDTAGEEAVRVDDKGSVIVTSSAGERLWSKRAEVGDAGTLMGVSTGDADGDGRAEVATTGWRYVDGGGVVELYDGDGTRLWSKVTSGSGEDVRFADIDSDGRDEVITVESSGIDANCTVAALDEHTGEDLWRVPIARCLIPEIAVGDVDDDGLPEIAYGDRTLVAQPHAALLEHDGTVTWNLPITDQIFWVEVRPGSILHAGYGTSSRGSVFERRASDGSVIWSNLFPDDEDMGSAIRFATFVPDVTGDERPEIAVSSDDGLARLVDGAGAGELWTTRLEPSDRVVMQRHQSGPVTYVPAQFGRDARLVVAQGGLHRKRADVFALGLDGAIVGASAMEGEGEGAAPITTSDGITAVLVGAGLGTYLFDTCPGCTVDARTPTVLDLSFERERGHVSITSTLTDAGSGIALEGMEIEIVVEGLEPFQGATDADGKVTLRLLRRDAKRNTGVIATFAGTEEYASSRAEGVLP